MLGFENSSQKYAGGISGHRAESPERLAFKGLRNLAVKLKSKKTLRKTENRWH